jgi:hypothetical protein
VNETASAFLFLEFMFPHSNHHQRGCVPFSFSPFLFTWTFLKAQSTTKSKSNDTQRHTHTHSVSLFWTSDEPNGQHSQETDIHATGGIRTRNPNKRSAADPRLRPRGHRDRLSPIIIKRKCIRQIFAYPDFTIGSI